MELVLLVYKVVAVFNKINAVKSRVTTAVRFSTAGWIKWLEDQDMRVNEIYYERIYSETSSRSDKGYHAVPPPYTGNYIPLKPDLMLIDKQVESESVDVVSNVSSSAVKTVESKVEYVDVKKKGVYNTVETKHVKKNRFSPPIIEDWISDDERKVEFKPKVEDKTIRPSIKKIKFVKPASEKVEKGNPQHKEYKEKGVIDNGCARHMTGNKCHLTGYEDYDGRFVSIGDGKGRISGKDKIKSGTLDLMMCTSLCDMKGIKREFSVARTPQQNGVAERKNRTLIEATRTMALVIKPHNKTPYELIRGRPPLIDFMKPFGCPATILKTRDYLGKFDEKADEGFFVGYYVVSKAMRVFNKRTRIVEETLNNIFLENAPSVKGNRPDWFFDIDSLTISMNYVLVVAGFQTNGIAGTKDNIDSAVYAGKNATEVDASQVSDNGEQEDKVTRTVEEEVDMNNVFSSYTIPDASLTKFLKDHHKDQVIDKWAISTKWVLRNKKNERGIVIKNKARLVAQGHTQEEGIDYDKLFAPVARIKAIWLFLAYASFKDFIVYQMDVKSAFLHGKIEEESSGPTNLEVDEIVYKEWEDIMEMAATNASSLEAEQDSGNINRTKSMPTLNEPFPHGTGLGRRPRCQVTILGGAKAQTRIEAASKPSNDPPLSRGHTLGKACCCITIEEIVNALNAVSSRLMLLNEIVYKEWEDIMEMATTNASSLEAEQDSGNINRTQSMPTLNEPFPHGTGLGRRPRCQVTILGGAKAQTRIEAASKPSNDP
nr:hypothetical protein [Tanacetum cinerariifolium]